jgi:hypothetical protein
LQQVSDYFLWERWLMRRSRCRGIFPRDTLTAKNLESLGISVSDLGNPMMDDLEPAASSAGLQEAIAPDQPALLLLPGSRPPEAYQNWRQLMAIVQDLPAEVTVYAAITANLDAEILHQCAGPRGIPLLQGQFSACAHRADVVLAMAGTATEQCVGLGKPVVIVPGTGPQFTYRFAEAQTRLLGSSIYLTQPLQAAGLILQLIEQLDHQGELKQRLRLNGYLRMGSAGAGRRIARKIVEWIRLPTGATHA